MLCSESNTKKSTNVTISISIFLNSTIHSNLPYCGNILYTVCISNFVLLPYDDGIKTFADILLLSVRD